MHHAIIRIIEPIFDKSFIYDSCANRKGKGNLFAIKRFCRFMKKVSRNGKINGWFNDSQVAGYCLKADIRHYFNEVNHEILLNILRRKIKDKKIIWLIEKILENSSRIGGGGANQLCKRGMPLGNLTSQFFANVYLNELDYFVKHLLKEKYYIRYVDDFVILHNSKEQISIWKAQIDEFLKIELKIDLHPDKSKIIPLSKGIDFVGFRTFYHHKLLRRRNIRKMFLIIEKYKKGEMPKEKLLQSFCGWLAYSKWADSFQLRKEIVKTIYKKDLINS